ncbi:MAG TPA: LamG-like jellyroll fold domain-containing protein [Micromonosporaceae bacterium]
MGDHTNGQSYATRGRGAFQGGVRPLAYVLTAAVAIAVAVVGSHTYEHGLGGFGVSPALAMPLDAPAAAALPATTATPMTVSAIAQPRATATTAADYAVRYTFDGGAANLNAGRSGPLLTTLSANNGALRTTKHAGGDAIGFPATCAEPGTATCARAIIESTGDVSDLNPGRQRIRFGADIRMRRVQTSDGENVVQKGYATGGSEYKLQVDGGAGKPSCAVVGTTSAKIYLARSSERVDDGDWHTVSCDLHGGRLRIIVDGTVRGHVPVPTSLTISNGDALRIGGKGKSPNNDQFSGELDNVWVTVGP